MLLLVVVVEVIALVAYVDAAVVITSHWFGWWKLLLVELGGIRNSSPLRVKRRPQRVWWGCSGSFGELRNVVDLNFLCSVQKDSKNGDAKYAHGCVCTDVSRFRRVLNV